MNYYKIIFRTGEAEWETGELIIDESQNDKVQEQIANGNDFLLVKGQTIKRTAIVSITSANDIVRDYQKQGIKIDGLLEPVSRPLIGNAGGRMKTAAEIIKEKKGDFFKKMGWKSESN